MNRISAGRIVVIAASMVCLFGLDAIPGAAVAVNPSSVQQPAAPPTSPESSSHRSHAAAMVIRRLGLSSYRQTFGGLSFSQSGSHLDIRLTDLDPATEQALLAAVPPSARSAISFEPAAATEQQLDTVQAAITADMDFLTQSNISIASWAPDYIAGKNDISVVNPTVDQISFLQDRYGPTVLVDSVATLPVADASRISDSPPWHAGDFLSDGGSDCTSGVGMHNAAGQKFMVTAAHCYALGDNIYNAAVTLGFTQFNQSTRLGSVYARDNRTSGNDAELIPTYSSQYMWVGGTATTAQVTLDPAYAWVGPGNPVCVDGAFEGNHCSGVTGTEGCINLSSTFPTRLVCNEVSVSGTNNQMAGTGDSGGPVYIQDAGSDYIVGIWSAGNGTVDCTNWQTQPPKRKCGASGWYADISTIAQLWGLDVNN
jgi:hypothetical protein